MKPVSNLHGYMIHIILIENEKAGVGIDDNM